MSITTVERDIVSDLGFDTPYDAGFSFSQLCAYVELAYRLGRVPRGLSYTCLIETMLIFQDPKLYAGLSPQILGFLLNKVTRIARSTCKGADDIATRASGMMGFVESTGARIFKHTGSNVLRTIFAPYVLGCIIYDVNGGDQIYVTDTDAAAAFLKLLDKADDGFALIKFVQELRPTPEWTNMTMLGSLELMRETLKQMNPENLQLFMTQFQAKSGIKTSTACTWTEYSRGELMPVPLVGSGLALWTAWRIEKESITDPASLLHAPTQVYPPWPHHTAQGMTSAEPRLAIAQSVGAGAATSNV